MPTLLSRLGITGFSTYTDFYPAPIHREGAFEEDAFDSDAFTVDPYTEESALAVYTETKLLAPLVFEEQLPDDFDGAPGTRQFTAELSNVNVNKIASPRQLLGVKTTGEQWNVEAHTRDEVQTGVITEVDCTPERMTLTIEENAAAALQTMVPRRRVRDLFPSADFSTLAGGDDPSIILPWGTMYKVGLPLCQRPYLHAEFQMNAASPGFLYLEMTDIPDYLVQAGDKLQYDLRDPLGGSQIALDLGASDGINLRDTGAVDQNGLSSHPLANLDAVAVDRWYRREIPLNTMVGKNIITYTLACECDTTRVCVAWIANARIVNSQGDVQLTIFDEQTVTGFVITARNPITNEVGLVRRAWWDYGPVRCTSLIVHSAYRGNAVITPGTFTLEEPLPGMRTLRFTDPQRDVNGEPAAISLTFSTTDYGRNPAAIKKFLMSDFADGGGLIVDTASFDAAATVLNAAGIFCDGGLTAQRPLVDVIEDLCFHGEYLGTNEAGQYTDTADSAALHTLSPLRMGEGDGEWENVSFGTASFRLSDQLKQLTIKALLVNDFGGTQTYAVSASRSQSVNGSTITQEEPYLASESADREAHYRFTRNKHAALYKAVFTSARRELTPVRVNMLVIVQCPNDPDLDGKTMLITGRTSSADSLSFRLRGYDAEIYQYASQPVQMTGVPPLIDYRFTAPAAPTNFAVWVQNLHIASDGTTKNYLTVRADAPSTNVSELKFRALKDGSVLFTEVPQRIIPGQVTYEAVFPLEPGLVYDFECYAYNAANSIEFRYSAVAQINNYTTDGDTIAPSAATAVVARQAGAKVVEIAITATLPTDWRTIYLYRNVVNDSSTAALIDQGKTVSFHDQNITYATQYWYWVKIVDNTGNQSPFSPPGSILTARLVEDDYEDDSISTTKYKALSVTSAKIGNLAVTNAKIQDAAITNAKIDNISATKITTGRLRVDEVGAGASDIFVASPSSVRLETAFSSPARLVFQSTAGAEGAELRGLFDSVDLIPTASDNGIILRLGSTINRWSSISMNSAANILLTASGTTGVFIGGRWSTDQLESSAPPGTVPNRRIPLRNVGGTIIGYIWVSI